MSACSYCFAHARDAAIAQGLGEYPFWVSCAALWCLHLLPCSVVITGEQGETLSKVSHGGSPASIARAIKAAREQV